MPATSPPVTAANGRLAACPTGRRSGPITAETRAPGQENNTVLTADETATIAGRFGLSLADAAALRLLADDVEQAEAIAARFVHAADPRADAFEVFAGLFDDTEAHARALVDDIAAHHEQTKA
jgi:hypothetical protein